MCEKLPHEVVQGLYVKQILLLLHLHRVRLFLLLMQLNDRFRVIEDDRYLVIKKVSWQGRRVQQLMVLTLQHHGDQYLFHESDHCR